nr:LysR family transcriptional regulator [Burkholderia ubonensis]
MLKRGRPLQLTEAGRSFFGQSRLLLQELERIEEEAQEAGASLHGTLRLAVPTTFMTRQLAPLLARCAAKYPALCVDVEAEDRLSNLQDGHFDIEMRPRREFERQAIADRPTKRTQRGEAVTVVIHRMPFVQIREIDRDVIIQDVAEADFVGAPMHVATLGRASVAIHCIDVDLSFKWLAPFTGRGRVIHGDTVSVGGRTLSRDSAARARLAAMYRPCGSRRLAGFTQLPATNRSERPRHWSPAAPPAPSAKRGRRRLLNQRRVLVRHLIHLRHRLIHLFDAPGL